MSNWVRRCRHTFLHPSQKWSRQLEQTPPALSVRALNEFIQNWKFILIRGKFM